MRTSLRSALGATLLFGLALALSACPADKKLPIGSACNSGDQCVSGLCAGDVCLDPAGDEDGDTLINSLEQTLGSDPLNADTDGDGIPDGGELDGISNVDTDGDGLPDVVESATNDLDGDCITDQYDAQNDVQNGDLSPMRDVVCSALGICDGQDRALFGVLCPEGLAVCDYTNVVGYEAPEATCDGLDQNCDGAADDGFPDQDDDGIADCVDTDFDNDGVADDTDNCPLVANDDQLDAQSDGIGDTCATDFDLAFTLAPVLNVTAGAPFDVTVVLQDGDGSVATRFHGAVTLTLQVNDDGASALTGTVTVNAVDGIATFTDLVINPAGLGLALVASSGDLASGTSASFDAVGGDLAELRPTGAPTARVAGDTLSVTLTAWDAFDNVLTGFAGTVAFSATDPLATLPADYTYTASDAGVHTFDGLVLRTSGVQTVTVSDASNDAVLATFEVTVDNAPATSFSVAGLPSPLTAGAATTLTVRARDPFDNVADDYAGTAHFTTDDDAATVPADHAFVAGDAGTFVTSELVLRTAGAHALVVAGLDDSVTTTLDVTVVHAAAAGLVVTAAPSPFTAGTPFSVTVTVVDAFGNVVTDFTGTVALTSTDPLATLPAAYAFTAADQGIHVFTGVTLVSSGDHTVAAGSSGGVTVAGGVAVTVASGSDVAFELTGIPSPATAGAPFDVTLTVKDSFGNVVSDYAGTVALLSSDGAAALPAPVAMTAANAGVASFPGVVLKTAGVQSLTAADTEHGVSQSTSVTVTAGAAATLAVTGPSAVTAGTPFQVTVSAKDAYGNPATGYTAALTFASSDVGATLPSDGTLPAGSGAHTFGGLALTAAGAQTVTVTDPGDGALTATLPLTVSPAAAASVAISGAPATATAGQGFGLTATLHDSFGNVAAGYTGQLAVSTSDASGVVPAAHTFTAGDAGAFAFTGVTLKTAGQQTVTISAPGNAALTASTTVDVGPASATTLVVTPSDPTLPAGVTTSLVVRANDAYGNRATGYTGTAHVTSSDAQATLPGDASFTGADAGQHVFGGVTFRTVGVQTVTVTDVAAPSITGQASVTVAQGSQIVYELTGIPTTTQAGTTFSATLSVKDTFGNPITNYAGAVAFSALDPQTGQPIGGATLPATYTFVGADQGTHTFTGLALTAARATTVRVAEVGSAVVSASAVVTVSPAQMSRLAIDNTPASVTAGTAFGLRVTAYDAFDNVATGYTGPVAFSASRTGATLPSDGTLTAGTRSFNGLVLTLAGDTTVTVADGEVSAGATLPVGHGAPASLALTALPASVAAGAAQSLTATVKDSWGNVATGFTGTATVVTNDPKLDATSLDFLANHQGQRTLSITFQTAGSRQLTVDAGGALSATRTTTVTAAAASTFQVSSLPSQLTAGSTQSLTVTLYDPYGNVATAGASGAFTVSSTDGAATLVPTSLTIGGADGGSKSFTATLVTAGAQTVTVAHAQLGSVDRPTTVRAAAASRIIATDLPPTVTAGSATSVVVRVADTYGNTVTNYGGIVNVSSSDEAVTLSPGASLTFPAGQPASVTLTATFETAGAQHLDFLDTGLGAGGVDATSTTVKPAAARDLVATPATGSTVAGTPFTFTVAIYDAFGNLATGYTGTVSFTSTDPIATLPAATQYTAAFAGTHDFSATLFTAGARRITATGSGLTGATSDDVDRTVSARPTLHHMGVAPSASTVTAGVAFSATITPYDAWNNVITSFSDAVTMTLGDPAGNVPSPVTMSGVTSVSPIVMYTAGSTPRLVTATYNSVSGSGSVTVLPGAADHKAFSTQPSAGFVASPLPSFSVAVYDAWGNVKTNLAATTITVSLGRNAGPGHLGGTVVANTASGVATFSSAQIDRPGAGYDLTATGGPSGTIRSARFDVRWRPATLVGTPTTTGSGGCRDVSYTLAQANAHPSDVLVEYRIGTGPFSRATQAPATSGAADGTRGVATSAAGVVHAYRWDMFGDLGPTYNANVTVRLTPVIDGVAGTAKTTAAFSADLRWNVGMDEHPITAGIKPGPVAVGDFDRNGLDDLLTMARDSGEVDVFYQISPGAFSEVPQALDLSGLDLVALSPWQASPHHTLGFFALDRLGDQLYIFTRTVQGVGSVGWSFSQTDACPTPASNNPVAMAVADVIGDATQDVVVACDGDGGSQPATISIATWNGQAWGRGFDVDLLKRPTAVEVADLGHDGRRDILVGDSSGLVTLIYNGEGFCSSAACGAQAVDMPAPRAMAVADFDNDGQLDVFVVHGDTTASVVHGDVIYGPQGNISQYFSPQLLQLPLDIAATSVVARDVNEDGRVDLVVGSAEGDAVEVLLGQDFAPWGVIATGQTPGSGVNSLWVGDLNADGMTDIVAGRDDAETPSIVVLRGKSFQQCRPSFETSGVTRYNIDSEQQMSWDVDRDGRPDTVWRTSYDSVVTGLVVGYGDGAGGYLDGFAAYYTGQPPTDMAVGDLNGDGLMDAVLNDGYTDNVDVALQSPGASGGGLVAGTPVPVSGGNPRGLGVADVNKDGYQDLAFYQYVNDQDSACIQLSTGARTWQAATAVKCIAVDSGAGRVQLLDLDGDGVEEMVYANAFDYYEPTLIEVRRQLTPDSGDFGPPEEFPSCYGGADLHFSDVDGDGRQDILISCGADGGSSPYGVMIVRQAADGTFGGLTSGFGTYSYSAWGHGIGDFDGDLLDDLTRAGSITRHARAGSGFVTPTGHAAVTGNGYVQAMATADLDGDGLVDAVTGGSSSFHVILQAEPGKFVAPVTYTLSGVNSIYGLAVGDVDGDGRPDVAVGVFTNTGSRQLRIYRQTLTAPATFDVVNGFTALSPSGNGYPYVVAIDDIAGVSAASVLVSQATFAGQDEFDVFVQGAYGTFTKVPSDPYTSTFPSPVVTAGFGWFGSLTYREPWIAGRCGSSPCVTLATLGACDIPGTICYKATTTINLGGAGAAPLYTNITGAAVADLDHDGFDDVVANLTGANGGHVYAVIRQNPTKPGEFLAMQTFPGASTGSSGGLQLADIDHDGRLDIVAQYDGGAMTGYEVLRGLGTGTTFGQAFAVATALTDGQGPFTLDDVDLDGWLDLMTLNPNNAELLVAPQR